MQDRLLNTSTGRCLGHIAYNRRMSVSGKCEDHNAIIIDGKLNADNKLQPTYIIKMSHPLSWKNDIDLYEWD